MLATARSALIWPQPSSSMSCSSAQAVVVGRRAHQAGLLELGDLLLAEPVDVHRAARDEVLEQLPAALGAVAVRALGEDLPLELDRLGVAERAVLGRPRDRRALLVLDDVRRGREDLRDDVAGAQDDDVVARADVLAGDVLLVVQRRQLDGHAADVDGLELGERVQVAELADVPLHALSLVTFVVGGNFQAIAQRGSRPTTPRRRCSSTSSTLTTTPSISKSSWPRRSCHAGSARRPRPRSSAARRRR